MIKYYICIWAIELAKKTCKYGDTYDYLVDAYSYETVCREVGE